MFLEQYWGGPRTYSDQRGHPRLRMRHAPFRVGPIERDAWLRCMQIAVDEAGLSDAHRAQLWQYLTYAAASMVNSDFYVAENADVSPTPPRRRRARGRDRTGPARPRACRTSPSVRASRRRATATVARVTGSFANDALFRAAARPHRVADLDRDHAQAPDRRARPSRA